MTNDLGSLKIDRAMKDTGGRQRHWGRWFILAIIIIALLGWFMRRDAAPIKVETMQVQSASVGGDRIALNATGYIIAAHKIELAPKIVGRVAWVGVERADKVDKGQTLVKLEDDEYRARTLQAQGQLDANKARLAELSNGSRPEEVEKSLAELNAAKAELQAANARLERSRAAAQSKAVSMIDVEEATYRAKAQEARVASLQQTYELMRKGPRQEQIDAQKAMVAQAQGMLDLAKVDLDNTIIKAPVKGTILERNVEVGEYVTTGFVGDRGAKGYVVSLADLADLRVELDISQDDFAKIAHDQRCIVTTDAYPDRKYDGDVDLIAPEANRQKATVQVRVKILNPDELLRPDMNASVAFLASAKSSTTTAAPAITIPASAIRDNAVFIVSADKAVRKMLELGSTTPQGVIVKSGLSAGDELILTPPENLKDGSKITR